MATRISDASRNAAIDAVTARLDAGPAAGYIQVRVGTQPASVATAPTGALLATLTLSDPAFNAAAAGSATARPITSDASADATGVAGWFRAFDSTGVAVIDGACSGTGGTGEMKFDDVNFVAGGAIAVSSWTVTMSGG